MPRIIPIKDLKNTAEISEKCHESSEPVFITKNGYGDMVIMSIETYERFSFMNDVYQKLDKGEASISAHDTIVSNNSTEELKNLYGI